MGVHAHHGHLDRFSCVEIVVAEVICACLKLLLGELRSVVGDSVENRLGGAFSNLVGNKVEVVDLVSIELNQRGLDYCAGV